MLINLNLFLLMYEADSTGPPDQIPHTPLTGTEQLHIRTEDCVPIICSVYEVLSMKFVLKLF